MSGVNVSAWDVSNCNKFEKTFYKCKNFNCDLSNWEIKRRANLKFMFGFCDGVTSDTFKKWGWELTDNQKEFIIVQQYKPKDKQELLEILGKIYGYIDNLNCIDVSNVTDFSYIFYNFNDKNIDISKWNVGNGVNFSGMFLGYELFNCDLSNWNVSNGKDFSKMFYNCKVFTSDLSRWNVSNGENFY